MSVTKATGWTTIWRRQVALPADHGSWVFLLSPLLIGLFAGARITPASPFLVLAALAGFLIRQPVSTAVKAYSGRRSREDLPAARFWIVAYAVLGLAGAAGLVWHGAGYVLLLALPALPVFAWHLYLISRRAERRQAGVEIVGSGVLALAAPAGLWAGRGFADPWGWLLWALVWLQSAASIVHAYLRLEQRQLRETPDLPVRLRLAARALAYTTCNLAAATVLALARTVPAALPLPYALQWAETLWAALRPAAGARPTAIGIRQLVVSTLFTVLFIAAWRLS